MRRPASRRTAARNALNTTTSSARSTPSCLASSALPETFAIATVSNMRLISGNGSPSAARCDGAHRDFLEAAAGRQQADAGFDQADVALERRDRARAVHLEFAAAAERHAAHRGDDRHQRILEALAGLLEVRDHRFELVDLAGLERASAPFRSAPAENGSPVCQITSALRFFSASSIARCTPSSTASLTVFILVLNETMPMRRRRGATGARRRFPRPSSPVSNFSPISGSGKS